MSMDVFLLSEKLLILITKRVFIFQKCIKNAVDRLNQDIVHSLHS